MTERKINTALFTPLDLLPQEDIREKIAALLISGVPKGISGKAGAVLEEFRKSLDSRPDSDIRLVVFGGGTGLSNIIGGDSRQESWGKRPFHGLKELFPETKAVVCTTDNGGSTGELLKDLDMIAIGDIRHVLLSSIGSQRLSSRYHLTPSAARQTAEQIAALFNYRFTAPMPQNDPRWQDLASKINTLPQELAAFLQRLIRSLYADKNLCRLFQRPHCLGNLLTAAAIAEWLAEDSGQGRWHRPILQGLSALASVLGCAERAVMPVTSTPAQLVVRYVNGVEIPGEHKLERAERGVAIAKTTIAYSGEVRVYDEVIADIEKADIILFAPGSLFSSILPVLQVPGIADAVRRNHSALKMLAANIWVQEGETDISAENPDRRFYVSDMLAAYEKNIPGGTSGLFREILCVSMRDIPASILQRYGVEGKMPIFLDRARLTEKGYIPVECDIFSDTLLQENGVIQHDAERLARVVRGLYLSRDCFADKRRVLPSSRNSKKENRNSRCNTRVMLPSRRYREISRRIAAMPLPGCSSLCSEDFIRENLAEILWDNPVIALSHLDFFQAIELVSSTNWGREQQWDNVFSYFDPVDYKIKMRTEKMTSRRNIELAFCIGLGESLLGNYAEHKEMADLKTGGITPGRIFHLYLRPEEERRCFFSSGELLRYMDLARMYPANKAGRHFTRLLNNDEGFTPPGLLMGLTYAWYVDNRLASHIEYKMSVLGINYSSLIPNQIYMAARRKQTVDFFREVVFAPYWSGDGDG